MDKTANLTRETPARAGISPALLIFSGVLLLRLFVLLRLTGSQFLLPSAGDMQFYNEWALRILHGHWTEHTAFYGLPLYAYLLAGLYQIFGYNPFVPGLLQACLEGGTAVLIYQLGLAVFQGTRGKFAGLLAAIGWAFFQPAQGYSVILMPTAALVFVFWWIVWQIVRRPEMPAIWMVFLLGMLMGFTAMGIATILFLVPLVLAALFLRWQGPLTARLLAAALLVGGVFLGASPAWMHNYFVARDPVFLSAHSGVNFWIGNNPVATGYPKFPPGLRAGQTAMLQDSINVAEKAAGRPLKRSEVSAYWSAKARDWIQTHPGAWVQLLGTKVKNFWNAFRYDDISVLTALREQSIILPGEGFGLVAAFGLPGLLLACWRFPASRWIAAAVFLHMASLLTVFVTERYRLAAVPGLLLFAAFGLWQLWQNLARARWREAALFLALLFCSTAFVAQPQRDPTLWALDTYNSGLQALEAHQLPLAQRKLDLAYAYSPFNAEINFARGNLHLELGDDATAKSDYLAAIRLDPQHSGAFNNLGVLALREARWDLAARFFQSALASSPNDAKTWFLLAQAERARGELSSARSAISRAIKLDPRRPEFTALREEIERTGR